MGLESVSASEDVIRDLKDPDDGLKGILKGYCFLKKFHYGI